MPFTRRDIGSSGLSQACQNFGIAGRGIVTPQKRPNVIIIGGLRRFAMNALGVIAATTSPSVIEKNYLSKEVGRSTSVSKIMRNWYPARSEA